MYTVKTLNKIAPIGTERFNKAVIAVNEAANNPDAIMVRSAEMLNYDFNQNLLSNARAGARRDCRCQYARRERGRR